MDESIMDNDNKLKNLNKSTLNSTRNKENGLDEPAENLCNDSLNPDNTTTSNIDILLNDNLVCKNNSTKILKDDANENYSQKLISNESCDINEVSKQIDTLSINESANKSEKTKSNSDKVKKRPGKNSSKTIEELELIFKTSEAPRRSNRLIKKGNESGGDLNNTSKGKDNKKGAKNIHNEKAKKLPNETIKKTTNVSSINDNNNDDNKNNLKNNNCSNESKEAIPFYKEITKNIYLFDRKKSKSRSATKKMVCDCLLSREDKDKGLMGCGDDCLNRMLMIECGSRCPLGSSCSNKRFQNQENANVEPFKTKRKGWGLRALEVIPSDTFIMEYVGEVVDSFLLFDRIDKYEKRKLEHSYFMALATDQIIDATKKGNITRFINHSCEPNAVTQKWTVNGEIRIGFFTIRQVEPMEEITFDYRLLRYGKRAQKCYCETKSCRGYIGSPEQVNILTDGSKIPKSIGKEISNEINKDNQLDAEIESFVKNGINDRNDITVMARLMVNADTNEQKEKIINIIESLPIEYLRLFIDYRGLKLMSAWMTEIDDVKLKALLLESLKLLPIPNKNVLTESNVYAIVEKWAEDCGKEYVSFSEKKSGQTNSETSDENETTKSNENNNESAKETDKELNESENVEDAKKKQSETKTIDGNETDMKTTSIAFIAKELLESWKDLKVVFRIPRIVRAERHQAEAEADKKSSEDKKKATYKNENSHISQPIACITGHYGRSYEQKKRYYSLPKITREDHRRLFEKKVAEDDAKMNAIKLNYLNNNNNNSSSSNNNNNNLIDKVSNNAFYEQKSTLTNDNLFQQTPKIEQQPNKAKPAPVPSLELQPSMESIFQANYLSQQTNYALYLQQNYALFAQQNYNCPQLNPYELYLQQVFDSNQQQQYLPILPDDLQLLPQQQLRQEEEQSLEQVSNSPEDLKCLVPKYTSPLIDLSDQNNCLDENYISPSAIDNVDYNQIKFNDDDCFEGMDKQMFDQIYPPPGIFYITPDGKTYFIPEDCSEGVIVKENVIPPLPISYTKEKPKLPLPEDWECGEVDGHYYYFNRRKHISQWHPPLDSQIDDYGAEKSEISPVPGKPKKHKKRRTKEDIFRVKISECVVKNLSSYMKESCKRARIKNNSDFKQLARKLTYKCFEHEVNRHKDSDYNFFRSSVEKRIKEIIKHFMSRYGEYYIPPKEHS